MIITLTCLVVAMTAGAATLSWIEPTSTSLLAVAAQVPDPVLENLMAIPESPVRSSDPTSEQRHWVGITIHHRSANQVASAAPLIVGKAEERFHFIVSPEGQVRQTAYWREGVQLNDRRRIVVCMLGTRSHDQVPSVQWRTLMRLLGRLQARLDIPQSAIELDDRSDPAKCPDLPNDAVKLQQLLASVGIAD